MSAIVNLLDGEAAVTSIEKLKQCGKLVCKQSSEEITAQFKVFSELRIKREFFNMNAEGYVQIPGSAHHECIGLGKFVTLANMLCDLRGMAGFESLSAGFSNSEQFSATIFEVECAYHSRLAFSPKTIELGREVEVHGRKKSPDFSLTLSDGTLLHCECKSLESLNRAKGSRALRLIKEIEPDIHPKLIPGVRAEIAFKALPQHWNRNYGEQLAAALGELVKVKCFDRHLELNFDGKQKTWLRLGKIGEDPYFKCTLNVGNQTSNNATLIIGEMPNLKSDIKESIRDALTQLPSDIPSVIFIYSLNEHFAKEAIVEFFRDNDLPFLVGVISWTNKAQPHQNPRSKLKLTDIYKP